MLIGIMSSAKGNVFVPPVAPENTVVPSITGGTSVGSVLTVVPGTWINDPATLTYWWQEYLGGIWTDIAGENGTTYTTDHAGDFRVRETGANTAGSNVAYSAAHTITSGVARTFGYTATVGSGDGFPGQTDRALASKFTKSHNGRITGINFRLRSDTVSGANARITCHADDAGGSVPGTLLWVSGTVAVPAGGSVQTPALPSSGIAGTDNAGTYWLVFVPDNFQANIAKSNVLADGQTRMANGTYSYASPPSSWPGTDGTYDGPICAWCDYIG